VKGIDQANLVRHCRQRQSSCHLAWIT